MKKETTNQQKARLMRELRARRAADGLVEFRRWVSSENAAKLAKYCEKNKI